MSNLSGSDRTGIPYNPGVRELVANKRRWAAKRPESEKSTTFRGWHEAGRLPHRDETDLIQFVTFRLADSIPKSLPSEWGKSSPIENDRQRRMRIELYLDQGHGKCYLRLTYLAQLTETALRTFAGTRYDLRAWVVMSNHVHVLFKVGAVPMSSIMESWKKYVALKANRFLRRRGAFWAPDYFDVYMRDEEHERKTIRYIENNPTKANLVLDPKDWKWSSARFRDSYGRLLL